jgi:hypothetical protein
MLAREEPLKIHPAIKSMRMPVNSCQKSSLNVLEINQRLAIFQGEFLQEK